MSKTQDRSAVEKSVSERYPTPLSFACKDLFGEKIAPETIIAAFDEVCRFIGYIGMAAYLAAGGNSRGTNMLLSSGIRRMTPDRWIDLFVENLPHLSGRGLLPGIVDFYKTALSQEENPVVNLRRFRRRAGLSGFPCGDGEVEDAREQMFLLLESLKFLSDCEIFAADDSGAYILRGIAPKKMNIPMIDTKPGQIFLVNKASRRRIPLRQLFKFSGSPSGIDFINFSADHDSYLEIVGHAAFASGLREYKNALSGNPDFSEFRKHAIDGGYFKEIIPKIISFIENPSKKRMLIESYPGGGGGYLVPAVENLANGMNYNTAAYYLKKGHPYCSATLFARFFYRTLNDLLEQPHKLVLQGAGWHDFKQKVMQDFSNCKKSLLFVINGIQAGLASVGDEKISISEFLGVDLPSNIKILMLTRRGCYPKNFDERAEITPLPVDSARELLGKFSKNGEEMEKICEFYGGLRSFIIEAAKDETVRPGRVAANLGKHFDSLLLEYNFYHPALERILRFMAHSDGPAPVSEIAEQTGIPSAVVNCHIASVLPVLKVGERNGVLFYDLFAPAFKSYVKFSEKFTFKGNRAV